MLCYNIKKVENHNYYEQTRLIYMLYENLRTLREEKGYTQSDIAEILNIKRQQYQLYESGKREIPTRFVKQLAAVYKVSTDCILGANYDEEIEAPIEELIEKAIHNYEKLEEMYDDTDNKDFKKELGVMIGKIKSIAHDMMINSYIFNNMAIDHKEHPEEIITDENKLFFL